MGTLSWLLYNALQVYTFIIVAYVVLSMLVSFQIVNPRVPIIAKVGRVLHQLSEPALRPIQRFLPTMAGFDFSPIVLLLILQLVGGWLVKQLLLMGL
ncbi:MAG: YggT family protein [Dongiaceae bacterium]